MELYRRAASGRLAEMLGADLLAVDERFLTLGLRHAAEIEWQSATPVVRMAFEEYALGVNAAITAAGRWKRPLELQLLGVRQEPWTPIDSLAIGKLFAWPTEAASYRQILDAGAWDLSVAVNTTGQSGHARSPDYFDQNLLWRSGRYHPLPFTRAAVEAATWGVWN